MKMSRCCFSSLSLTLLLFPLLALHAAPPAAPSNVRVIVLPAEVLLTWDASAGADHYRVYRADLDRRWMPVATQVTVPRYRDTDFRSLPCYYQIAACTASGECAATLEFTVNAATPAVSLVGARTRPLSDTSVSVAWTLQGAGGGNALLEVGLSLSSLQLVGVNPVFGSRHEFSVVNLAPNTTYFYRITSSGTNGAGFTYTEQFTTRPFTPPPPAVLNLSIPFPSLVTDEDTPVDFTLTAMSPPPLTFFIANVPFGTIWGASPNFTYVSGPERTGLDFFDCGYSDAFGPHFATVFVTVNQVLDPPIALDRSATVVEDVGGLFKVQATAWDSDPLAVDCLIVNGPTNGTLTKLPGEKMSVQYIPNPNFNGVDHFTFRAFDGRRIGNVATVRLRVTPANDPPVANPQTVTVFRNTTQTITLNSSDPDGDVLNCVVLTGPSHGTLSGPVPNLTGEVNYTPATGYTGPDSFTWQVTDPAGGTASATVTIDVLRGNLPPTAQPGAVSTVSGVPVNVVLAGSDPDGDALAFSVLTSPAHGTLSGGVPNLVYTPAAGYLGADSFTFKVNDGQVDSAPAAVTVDVLRGNVAPTANAASVSTLRGVPVSVVLTGSDADGDALAFSVVTLPTHGSLSGVAPSLVYTPATGYIGADSFTFKASDGQADSVPAAVSIDVLRGNTAPTAAAMSVSTEYGVPVNVPLSGADPDGDALTFSVTTLPGHGTLSGVAPNLVYTPAAGYSGVDSFNFKVSDGQVDSALALVTLAVGPSVEPLCAVTDLTAVGVSQRQINLSWTDQCSRETGFQIERSKDQRRWEHIATVGANVTSYGDTGFNGSRTFYYRVRAHSDSGDSAYSNVASGTARPSTPAQANAQRLAR